MKTGVLFILAQFCVSVSLGAQTLEQDILLVSGASSMEELDGSVLEKFEALAAHPVPINTASRSRLLSCGLFSAFQVASLIDYRERCGDILSFAELAAVDGFPEAGAGALRRFVSLESGRSPGEAARRDAHRLGLQAKGGVSGGGWSAGAKAKYEYGERFSARAAWKERLSGALEYRSRNQNLTVIAGNFAARFGQGLAQWSGFSLGGYTSISSFMKKGSGIAPAWTYSPDSYLRGAAAVWEKGADEASLYATLDRQAGARYARYWRNGQAGVTALYDGKGCGKAAADGRFSAGGFDVFGEACFDFPQRQFELCAGAIWNASYDLQAAARLSCGKSKPAASAAVRFRTHFLSFEAGPARLRLLATSTLSPGRGLSLSFRLCETRKPSGPMKHELRADLSGGSAPWGYALRSDLAYCRAFAQFYYAETSFKAEKLAVYARLTGFRIRNWDDRIYVYERNAPGSFSVPAYYGTGIAASIYASMKLKHAKFYLRTEYQKSDRNAGKFGLSVSCTIEL